MSLDGHIERLLPLPPRDQKDFKIAFVCALPLEAEAVLQTFDYRWKDKGRTYTGLPGDSNSYTAGVIGKHNVVLAHAGGMGLTDASSVAANLRRSFPNIKLALLVGICGSVPQMNGRKMFLGDLIISTAVVQTDFGRKEPDGFRTKTDVLDALGRPNETIRSFIAQLRVPSIAIEITESIIQDIVQTNETYPGQDDDVCFEPTYLHKHHDKCNECSKGSNTICDEAKESTCEELGCDKSYLMKRITPEQRRLQLHFGKVASSSAVMRTGLERDIYAKEFGVIAFEMELAAIWDRLPTILLKGGCDYADSHKSKKWQDFAAKVAAAGARSILQYWEVDQSDQLDQLTQAQSQLLDSLHFPSMNYRLNQIEKNGEDTFDWIWEDTSVFHDWLRQQSGVFWIQGQAGSGKSTLMRYLWLHSKTEECLKRSGKDVCIMKHSFWLSGEPLQKNMKGCYLSILRQLFESDLEIVREALIQFPHAFKKKHHNDWSEIELQQMFIAIVIRLSTRTMFFLFLDGMDEIEGRENSMKAMKLISTFQLMTCVSSRPESFWMQRLRGFPQLLLQDHTKDDIYTYIYQRFEVAGYDVERLETKSVYQIYFRDQIEDLSSLMISIARKADGVFLWVHLVMDSVIDALDDHGSWLEITNLVNTSPSKMNDLYRSMLARRNQDNAIAMEEASFYFRMCLASLSYYDSGSLVLGVKSRFDGGSLRDDYLSREQAESRLSVLQERIPQICAGMINTHGLFEGFWTWEIRFSHRSVRDFLLDTEYGRQLHKLTAQQEMLLVLGAIEGRMALFTLDLSQKARDVYIDTCEMLRELRYEYTLNDSRVMTANMLQSLEKMSDHLFRSRWINPTDPLRLRREYFYLGEFRFAVDNVGIFLEDGFDEPAWDLLMKSCSKEYKNYLLFCAARAPDGGQTIDIILQLLEIGADPWVKTSVPGHSPLTFRAIDMIIALMSNLEYGSTMNDREAYLKIPWRCRPPQLERMILRCDYGRYYPQVSCALNGPISGPILLLETSMEWYQLAIQDQKSHRSILALMIDLPDTRIFVPVEKEDEPTLFMENQEMKKALVNTMSRVQGRGQSEELSAINRFIPDMQLTGQQADGAGQPLDAILHSLGYTEEEAEAVLYKEAPRP